MGIHFDAAERVFCLDTPRSSYRIGLTDAEGFVTHLYYGSRVPDSNLRQTLWYGFERPTVYGETGDQVRFTGSIPSEYPTAGVGDFGTPCLAVETADGGRACALRYAGHRIYSGKPKLNGLPATFGSESDCTTLEIDCVDAVLQLEVTLCYTAFENLDAITRSARITNRADAPARLTSALSACLDMPNRDFDLMTLHGFWSNERMPCRRPIAWGRQSVASERGISSHEENPFLAVMEHSATQTQGQVYAMSFVYSGNFLAEAALTQKEQLRLVMGIHPNGFCWTLEKDEAFQTPEAVLVFSDTGLAGMTHTFHDLYREHLIRGAYRDKARPSLVNNWEATYFNFDTEKLLSIARTAAKSGIEMLVLDDGWFGKRNDDTNSLGDWFVNEKKLPGGLKYLSDEIHKLGMQFGIWMEPEMVSPDSELYRAHPDYALQNPGRVPTLSRHQLVLDLSRQDVRDCIYAQIHAVLSSARIDYVKWDMNRPLANVWSAQLPADRQGELYHRYMLGVYELQERMLTDFPHLLLENCCSGGGRFDPGMLYYSPQIWTSDNTEAVDRLRIQEGTALVYPLSSMGAHVAACPSHTNRRVTPFATRGLVSLCGCFGYELDLTKLTESELNEIPGQLENYHTYGDIFRTGDYYRIASFAENGEYDVMMAVSKDQKTAVIVYVQVLSREKHPSPVIYPQGLDKTVRYRDSLTGTVLSGAGWMYGGMALPQMQGDYLGKLIILQATEA